MSYGGGPLPGGGELSPGGPPVEVGVSNELLVAKGSGELMLGGSALGDGVIKSKPSVAKGVNRVSALGAAAISGVPIAKPIIVKLPPARTFSPVEMI